MKQVLIFIPFSIQQQQVDGLAFIFLCSIM